MRNAPPRLLGSARGDASTSRSDRKAKSTPHHDNRETTSCVPKNESWAHEVTAEPHLYISVRGFANQPFALRSNGEAMTKGTIKPGTTATRSGQYEQVGRNGGRTGNERTV